MMIELAILVIAFSALNRFSGGGLGWRATFPGRPIYYAGAAAIIGLTLYYGLSGAIAGASFLVWRLPGWYGAIDAGTRDHTRLRDFAVMSARGLVAFPIFAHAGALIWLPLFGLLQGVTYDAANRLSKSRPVEIAEYVFGAVWGVALYLLL